MNDFVQGFKKGFHRHLEVWLFRTAHSLLLCCDEERPLFLAHQGSLSALL